MILKYSSLGKPIFQGLDLDETLDKFVNVADAWDLKEHWLKPKNNNKLIAYQWIRMPGVKEHPTEGQIETKVSDMSRAQKCTTCGRKIVHVFWVQDESGFVHPYGSEHLHSALGLSKPLTPSKVDKLVEEMKYAEKMRKQRKTELEQRASSDITVVNRPYGIPADTSLPFRNMRHGENVSAVFEKDGKYLRILLNSELDKGILKELGFVEVSPEKKDFNIYA